jgi:hypothetical protein
MDDPVLDVMAAASQRPRGAVVTEFTTAPACDNL